MSDNHYLKIEFENALKLRANGHLNEALKHLKVLAEMYPNFASTYSIMGDILWDLGKIQDAITCFEHVVRLQPKSELGSLGLFHTLWESGRIKEALREMKRYLSIADSEEYKALLQDMNQELNIQKEHNLND